MCQYLDGATFKVHHEVHSAHEILLDWEIAVSHLFSSDFSFRRRTVRLKSKNPPQIRFRKFMKLTGATFKVNHEVHSAHEILLDWEIAVSHLFSSDFSFRHRTVGLKSEKPPKIRLGKFMELTGRSNLQSPP
jgi:hypothetical protein